MTMGTHSRKDEDDSEDTVIGSDLSKLPSPASRHPETLGPSVDDLGAFESDLAEEPTIIVSRADPRHAERPTAIVKEAASDPPRKLFGLSIGTHSPISLEVPAYVGRRPSTPRIIGARMPRLVMVPSPSREVSSTHVEILQLADTVVVTDLGSTNGTTVTMPGYPPRTLRQGESLVVGAETLVDIGDGIRIVIVAIPDETGTEGNT